MHVQHKSKDVGSTNYMRKKGTDLATKEMFHSMNYENIREAKC